MAWFVTYEWRQRDEEPRRSSVVLRRTHPVAWIANPPANFTEAGLSNTLLFYAEIPDEVVDVAAKANYCGIEE